MSELCSLRILNFRNIAFADIHFEERVTVFHGENGQGKTNVLEAVHLLSNLYSFRTRKTDELIRRGEKEAGLRGGIEDASGLTRLGVDLAGEGKRASIDLRTPGSATEYLSIFRTVFFGPQDMELAGGSLSMRRRYVDRAAFSQDSQHLERLRNYSRVLRQRNEALRRGTADLAAWSEKLAHYSFEVTRARVGAMEGLGGAIGDIHRDISGGKEQLDLRLKAASKVLSKGVEGILEVLTHDLEEDRRRGFTRHGPHRERVEIALGGREIASHGSQGQLRTAAVSLKLALLSWIEEKSGRRPVFLLDDPGSELDGRRLGCLGDFLGGWKGQVLIAQVGLDDLPIAGPRGGFMVIDGNITKAD